MIVIGNHSVVQLYIPQTCTRYLRCDDLIATPNSEPVREDVVAMLCTGGPIKADGAHSDMPDRSKLLKACGPV